MRAIPAHWRKAPYALIHHRSVLLAVFAAALLAALASSSSPFVTTAAASEALKNRLADLSPYATGLEIKTITQVFGNYSSSALERGAQRRDVAVDGLRNKLDHVGPTIFTTEVGAQAAGPKGDSEVILITRTDALAHVKILRSVSGPGVWLADITAADAGLKLGDTFRVDGLSSFSRPHRAELRVKGIYRALAHSPETDYWGNLYQEIYPQDLDADVPPPYVFIDQASLFKLLGGRNATIQGVVELPVDPHSLTLAGARTLNHRFDSVGNALRHAALGQKLGCTRRVIPVGPGAPSLSACLVLSSLSSAVTLADRNASAVTPAVSLLSDLGTGLALAVAAAAGVFLVRRRRAEAALLYARGESVGTFVARSALEILAPTLAGGAAGFALAYGLTDLFAPSGSISSGTVWSGVAHGTIAVAIVIALLILTAGAAFLRLYDTGSRGLPWLRFVPWEVVLLGVALFLYLRIRSGGGVTHTASGAHTPTLAVFIFPLLLVAAVAGLAARAVRLGLRLGSQRTARSRHIPVYLALRRLGAARGLVVVLAVVTAASLGAFFYVETLAASQHHSTVEKAYMAIGSDANVIVQDAQQLPKSPPFPLTRVQFGNQVASLADGTPIDVMLVDPKTLAQALHWQSDWGPSPSRFLAELGDSASRPLPVIVTSDIAKQDAIVVSGYTIRTRRLAVVNAFPFMAKGIPLVITSYKALNDLEHRTKLFDVLGVLQTYVWGKGPAVQVALSMRAMEPVYPASTVNLYLKDPDVVLATRTFGFMRMIAIGAGVLALLGLLLYLQARQRSQAIASALGRRMGLSRVAETFSLCLELIGILVFAGLIGGALAVASAAPVVRRIDPLPNYPPAPIFTAPVAEIALAAGVLVVLAVVAGVLTSWFSRRTDVSEALRVA